MPIDCLKDCDAWCCRKKKEFRVVFDFTPDEAERMTRAGTRLSFTDHQGGGYELEADCTGLNGNRCRWHNTDLQPECCQDNEAGGTLCSWVRARVTSPRRYSEVE